jgi:hypothetical protein
LAEKARLHRKIKKQEKKFAREWKSIEKSWRFLEIGYKFIAKLLQGKRISQVSELFFS